ncbi:hypothetical protein GPECTOR_1g50 [Gonium pectorale]|uniref:Uncharacterized protein n=1 Tax=Gonium pectorale TaxID=33097 RepID=A0A150H304_GONPE|nr:hypothetical protein GPECTOR_1g50 [Gonium pectorale]|eukprot:KXZ56557.1 hypothetical protein GPECTOR_1g50 [Gonium pectorale]
MILSRSSLGLPTGALVEGLALRLAEAANTQAKFPNARTVFRTLTIFMGAASKKPDGMVRNFDNNYVAGTKTQVLRTVWLLQPGDFRTGLQNWKWIRFSAPYKYGGGDLVVEIQHTGPTTPIRGGIPFDAMPSSNASAAIYAPDNTAATALPSNANRPVLAMLLPYKMQ